MVLTYNGERMMTAFETLKVLETTDSIENAGFDIVKVGFDAMGRLIALGRSPNSGRGVVGKTIFQYKGRWMWNAGDYRDAFEDAESEYDSLVLFDVWWASVEVVE